MKYHCFLYKAAFEAACIMWNGTKHTKESWEIIYWFILWERAVSEKSYSLRCGDYDHHLSWSTIAFLYNTACDLANEFWALKADSPTPSPSCEAERYYAHILHIIHVASNAALYRKQWYFKINGDYNHRIVKNTNIITLSPFHCILKFHQTAAYIARYNAHPSFAQIVLLYCSCYDWYLQSAFHLQMCDCFDQRRSITMNRKPLRRTTAFWSVRHTADAP